MIAKLIGAFTIAYPMWETLLISALVVIVATFYTYFKMRLSICGALLLQILWVVIPVLLLLIVMEGFITRGKINQEALLLSGHTGSGIVLGMFAAFWLYTIGIGLKKVGKII